MVTDLGEKPTPHVEPAEPPPGGVDAVEDAEYTPDPVVPDLSTLANPHVDVPAPVAEGEETDEGASSDGASRPEQEPPA
jgi:hypothetical protein